MQGLMHRKRGLIMGVANDHSIAWGIARTLAWQHVNSCRFMALSLQIVAPTGMAALGVESR